MDAGPAEGIAQGHCSSLPTPSLKQQGTGPLSQHPKLRSVPLHWQKSLFPTKPFPLSSDNGPLLPHFPHLENVYSSTHHPIVLYKSLGGFINTGNVQRFWCFS